MLFHVTGVILSIMRKSTGFQFRGSFWSEIRLAYGLLPVVGLMEKRSIDPVPALQRVGIDRFGLLDPAYTIPIEKELDFLRLAIRKLDSPYASLDMAGEYHIKGFSVLGLAMLACATPLDILLLLLRYPRLAWGVFDCEFSQSGERLQVELQTPSILAEAEGFLIERDLACAQVVISEALGRPFQFDAIEFRHACRGDREVYEQFFGCELHFSAARHRVITNQTVVGQAMPQASASMLRFYEAQCDRMSRELEQPFRFADAVKRQLQRSPVIPRLDDLAAEFFMTPRTLQRRLANESSAYSELLQEVRTARAKALLIDTARNTDSIAEELGFSDAAAFSHAFKAWTGRSPQSFRSGGGHLSAS